MKTEIKIKLQGGPCDGIVLVHERKGRIGDYEEYFQKYIDGFERKTARYMIHPRQDRKQYNIAVFLPGNKAQ